MSTRLADLIERHMQRKHKFAINPHLADKVTFGFTVTKHHTICRANQYRTDRSTKIAAGFSASNAASESV